MATKTAHCLRCRRVLRAAASIAAGFGPTCRARIIAAAGVAKVLDGFSDKQCAQAADLIGDGGIVPTGHRGVWRTVSSRGDVTYLTAVEVCNCPAGRNDRPCYHRAAATLLAASSRKAA